MRFNPNPTPRQVLQDYLDTAKRNVEDSIEEEAALFGSIRNQMAKTLAFKQHVLDFTAALDALA